MRIHVKIQNQTYEVRVNDIHTRPIQVSVGGEDFEVWPEEMTIPPESYQPIVSSVVKSPAKPASIEKADMVSEGKTKQVKAPIPGVIISINVKEGNAVSFGQELCVLEAMKMKNAIRAGRNGTIRKILISEGDSVQHSQVLMEYSD